MTEPQLLPASELEPGITPELIARYVSKVDRRGPDECWPWLAGKNGKGYGSFFSFGKSNNAHRFAWRIYRGAIPKDKHVLHDCDTPECQNPNHHWLGTNQDNIDDKIKKGRIRPALGEDCNHKLTEENIRQIRTIGNSRPATEIAKMFNVCRHTIQRVLKKQFWKQVT